LRAYITSLPRMTPDEHSITAPSPIATSVYGYSATDAFGFTPSTLSHPYALEASNVLRYTCGDTYDTVITVRNPGTLDYQVTFEFSGDIDGSVTSPAPGATIVAKGKLDVAIHLKGLHAGKNRGYLV